MTNLFTNIANLLPSLHGWGSLTKAQALASAVLTLRPAVVLEIGVFGGRSFLPMAMALKEVGRGRAIGIDPWDATASKEGQIHPGDIKYWGQQCDHETVYRHFIEKAHLAGLGDVIDIRRKRSDEVEPPPVIDIGHLDGNHGPQTEKDAQRFAPNIRVGGLLFIDDLDWTGGFVRKAEQFCLSIGFVQLYTLDTGAMYQRIK